MYNLNGYRVVETESMIVQSVKLWEGRGAPRGAPCSQEGFPSLSLKYHCWEVIWCSGREIGGATRMFAALFLK